MLFSMSFQPLGYGFPDTQADGLGSYRDAPFGAGFRSATTGSIFLSPRIG